MSSLPSRSFPPTDPMTGKYTHLLLYFPVYLTPFPHSLPVRRHCPPVIQIPTAQYKLHQIPNRYPDNFLHLIHTPILTQNLCSCTSPLPFPPRLPVRQPVVSTNKKRAEAPPTVFFRSKINISVPEKSPSKQSHICPETYRISHHAHCILL